VHQTRGSHPGIHGLALNVLEVRQLSAPPGLPRGVPGSPILCVRPRHNSRCLRDDLLLWENTPRDSSYGPVLFFVVVRRDFRALGVK